MLMQEVGIAEPGEITVDFGRDTIIDLGENILLDPAYNIVIIDSFIWLGVDCINCPEVDLFPLDNSSISLTIADLNGCIADDGINIGVRTEPDVYVPSAFSPNGDGVNDVIFPFVGNEVEAVTAFRVFSRWGELVFDAGNAATSLNTGDGSIPRILAGMAY